MISISFILFYVQMEFLQALHRMLLTGTPMQNNLLELMSLLVFVMPEMFSGKTDYLKFLFTKNSVSFSSGFLSILVNRALFIVI